MDNLILKIICVAIALVLFAGFFLSDNNVVINELCENNNTNPASGKPDEIYNSSKGVRADIQSCVDSSANSDSYVDSNPK